VRKKEISLSQSGADRDGDLPKWVATVLAEIEDHLVMPGAVAGGQRIAVLSSLGRTMARINAGTAAILAALRVVNRNRCHPPLNDEILEGIAYDVVAGRTS